MKLGYHSSQSPWNNIHEHPLVFQTSSLTSDTDNVELEGRHLNLRNLSFKKHYKKHLKNNINL